MSRSERRGFTLIEVLLVVAIIATLVGMALPRMADIRTAGLYTTAIGDIRRIEAEALSYLAANRQLPADLATLGLDVLEDPWGRPYVYLAHYMTAPTSAAEVLKKPKGARRDKFFKPLNNDFDLYSLGPDGQSEDKLDKPVSRDDVVRAIGGAWVGKAEEF